LSQEQSPYEFFAAPQKMLTHSTTRWIIAVLTAFMLSGCVVAQAPATSAAKASAPTASPPAPAAAASAPPTLLQTIDRKPGEGPAVQSGDPVGVHYTGYLWSATAPDNKGNAFDSSIEKRVPIGFIVGAGRVIKGWDEGVIGMKVGGQRTLIIPASKAYGEKGSGDSIPPNSALVFDIELMSIIGKTVNASATPSPYVPVPKK
jgi:FKBP-type peptidyl-prolyl cis-trans isomerase FkpA